MLLYKKRWGAVKRKTVDNSGKVRRTEKQPKYKVELEVELKGSKPFIFTIPINACDAVNASNRARVAVNNTYGDKVISARVTKVEAV